MKDAGNVVALFSLADSANARSVYLAVAGGVIARISAIPLQAAQHLGDFQ